MRIIGDIHGDIENYMEIAGDCEKSIQVGDFGIGFLSTRESIDIVTFFNKHPQHRFIRGNHDNPHMCDGYANFIQDGRAEVHDGVKYMFIGGARSTDQSHRKEGKDWWKEEENSAKKFAMLYRKYMEEKPDVMITHDFPSHYVEDAFGMFDTSLTRNCLGGMFHNHQPKLWIGGHWHKSARKNLQNTQFITLNELEHIDI